jgi:signal transduction histidine kinase
MSLLTSIRRMTYADKPLWLPAVSAALFLLIVAAEMVAPANVVVAYGFVLPILLIATARDRRLMYLTATLCILATYIGIFHPSKPGRFVSALINRTVVAGVLLGVAYFAMTREEHKAREEAARAELALQTEHLLRANAQLVEVKDQLSRSERLAAMGQLVASVAHEVGTPLHSIAWHVQALGEDPGATADQQKRIAVVDSQISRVVRIIEDLLASTRTRKPVFASLSADRLIESLVTLMQPAFVGKGVALRSEPGMPGLAVRGDAEQLQQVLLNLLTNALAATTQGGEVVISVGLREATAQEAGRHSESMERSSGQMVTFTVRDTGCGMPEEHLDRAFEPFFTTKAIGNGTGLGLFLSRQIVGSHAGVLTIESEIGQGTTVVVALPRWTQSEGGEGGILGHEV